jgi:DNA-binding MarR family transcriptional regulator
MSDPIAGEILNAIAPLKSGPKTLRRLTMDSDLTSEQLLMTVDAALRIGLVEVYGDVGESERSARLTDHGRNVLEEDARQAAEQARITLEAAEVQQRETDVNLLLAALDDERGKPTELADRLGWSIERVHQAHGDALQQGFVERDHAHALQITSAGAQHLHPANPEQPLQTALDNALARLAETLDSDAGHDASSAARDYAIAYSALEVAQDRVDERAGRIQVDEDELQRWAEEITAVAGIIAAPMTTEVASQASSILSDLYADIINTR